MRPGMPVYRVGSPCAKRRYGCVGRVIERMSKYRGADGVLVDRLMLTCNRCDQAHGVPASASFAGEIADVPATGRLTPAPGHTNTEAAAS